MPTSNELCISCRRPKATLTCEVCYEPLCKSCDQFLAEGTFAFMSQVPDELTHTHYCQGCHVAQVEPALEKYNEILARAKGVYFFYTTQKRLIPVLKKAKVATEVTDCVDRNETILRLAFLVAEQGYNAVVEAEINHEKVRNEGWQKTRWRGKAVGALVDSDRLDRHFQED